MKLRRFSCLAAALAILAGCDTNLYGDSQLAEAVEQIRASRAQAAARDAGAPQGPVVTPQMLAGFDDPLITAEIPRYGTTGLLGIAETNGAYTTWLTPDRIAVVARDGVVTATRGLVGDLASARVPDIRTVRGQATRDHFYYGPDQRSVRERFFCNIATDGNETVEIVGRSYATTRIREECNSDDTTFTNLYWIDDTGKIRMSRQWISNFVSYIQIEAVNR